jgi:ribosomal-protein-alanine N-acetyltransferase
MEFRGYRADDFEAMYRLDEACFEPQFRFSRAQMRMFAEAENARVVIADEDGLAGFCVMHVEAVGDKCVGYVVTLDVAADWRRKGVAGELMLRAELAAQEDDCAAMALHVFVGNEAAQRFYERVGFVRSGRAVGFYGRSVDAWVYRKMLGPETVTGGEWASIRA